MIEDKLRKHLDQYLNYWVIGIVSVIALFFLPFLGSAVGLALVLPNTAAGWIVYIAGKIIVAVLNVLIFHCFFQQAKINVRDNANYVEALTILDKYRIKEQIYRSPEEFTRKSYITKGTLTFVFSVLGAFSLGQAILTFDAIVFLSYLFTIVMGIIAGVIQMKNNEIYWTCEMWHYAKKLEKEELEKEEALKQEAATNNDNKEQCDLAEPTTAG